MQTDARSIPQQILSGLKISALLLALVVALLVLFHFIPLHRIEAYYWHFRYGNSVEVGKLSFPVPKQWYVYSYSPSDVTLADLNSGDIVTIRNGPSSTRLSLTAWETQIDHPVPGVEAQVLGRRELRISGERVLCFERSFETKSIPLYPIECRTESGVEITFQPYIFSAKGHDQTFYSLLQQVHKLQGPNQ